MPRLLLSEFFSGWKRQLMADGYVMKPPDGARSSLRVRERIPLRRFRDVIDETLAEANLRAADARRGPIELFHSDEGEHAGIITLEIGRETAAQWSLALVAGDTTATCIIGKTDQTDRFATLRALVKQLAAGSYLGLGEIRRRRYVYAPPPGWFRTARPYVTHWYAPDYPRESAFMSVHDARPNAMSLIELDDRAMSIENSEIKARGTSPLRAAGGLRGSLWRGEAVDRGKPMSIQRAFLGDDRFLYLVELFTDAACFERATAVFHRLLSSIEPIPRPSHTQSTSESFWVD